MSRERSRESGSQLPDVFTNWLTTTAERLGSGCTCCDRPNRRVVICDGCRFRRLNSFESYTVTTNDLYSYARRIAPPQ
jgi:hypothetical protein